MMPITWPEFGQLHPFAPRDQAQGYHEAIEDLSRKLCEITGFEAFSMQPNSGAQGEYAGLLTIQAYHRAQGDHDRKVCLIPVSAHGTNPASAQMVGMEVVVTRAAPNGDIDLDDFRAKAEARRAGPRRLHDHLSPRPTASSRHAARGLRDHPPARRAVYLEGANMNALVGLVKPGKSARSVAPSTSQDLRHPPWRRRPPAWAPSASRPTSPPTSPPTPHSARRVPSRRPLRLGEHPPHLLGLLAS
jgi:glycine dehydrogenase